MSPTPELATSFPLRRVLLGLLLGMLAIVCAVVLQPFAIPMIWAGILAYTTWPAYRHVRRMCHERRTPAALLMTSLVALVLIAPLFWLAILLQDEIAVAYEEMLALRADRMRPLAPFLHNIPWLGDAARRVIERYASDPSLVRQLLLDSVQRFRIELFGIAGGVGRNAMKLLLAILTVFFLYRDGEVLTRQATRVVHRFFEERIDRYFHAAGAMTRAVIFGLLVTALVQGTIAGIGYAIFGVNAPVLFGILTAIASIVPLVGTFLVWGPAGLWLALSGNLWAGIGLLAWGTLLVHPADNVIRPILISNATQLPFLLIMFGALGGLAAFGLVGLFIGPVALAIATALWREWAE